MSNAFLRHPVFQLILGKDIIKFRNRKSEYVRLGGLINAHTNRFCVVQENIKPEVLKVQTELARSVH